MESAAGSSGDRSSSLRTLMFNDKIETPNLGDFLRVKETHNNNNNNSNSSGLTLGAVLSNRRGEDGSSSSSSASPVHSSSRTLLDIITEDPSSSRKSRKTWKHFRNKLRLKHTARTWTPNTNPIMARRLSPPPTSQNENLGQLEVSASVSRNVDDENGEEESEGENAIGANDEDQPVRMSLMALLEENDGDGSAYIVGDEDEEDEEEDGDAGAVAGGRTGGEYNSCCVCMVRHKGAAFIPCGHTFCRLCSRELWAQRGNCPICNNFILEILDIF